MITLTVGCYANEINQLSIQTIPDESQTAFADRRIASHVLVDKEWECWGTTPIRWSDGKIHAYYARWPKRTGHRGWMTHCEIAHAVADKPEGPFKTIGTVIESRHMKGWDVVNAHNPYVCVAEGKIHIYYISNDLRGEFEKVESGAYPSDKWLDKNRKLVRNRQYIGVASADSPEGPFIRSPKPVVVPHGIFKNIAVNPAVIFKDGKYVMIVKGDDVRHTKTFRIQVVGHSDHAAGPFVFQKKPIYDKAQTEDACIWFDQSDKLYHSVFHVMGKRDLAHITSKDSFTWIEAKPFTFMKKQFELSDKSTWKPKRVERPFVLTDDKGRAEWVYLAVFDKGVSGNVAVALCPKPNKVKK